MAKPRLQLSDLSPLEILGAFFGYFAVAKDAPQILKTLNTKAIVPFSLENRLLAFNPNPDFWYLVAFTLLALFVFFVFVNTQSSGKENPNEDTATRLKSFDDEDLYDNAAAMMKRLRRLAILKSLGLVLIREWILDRIKISLYGTFKRQSDWQPEPERFRSIDRINYTDGEGHEFQYSKKFDYVFVRVHPVSNDTYGPSIKRLPTWSECGTLLVASNFFLRWLAVHLILRPFFKVKKKFGDKNL